MKTSGKLVAYTLAAILLSELVANVALAEDNLPRHNNELVSHANVKLFMRKKLIAANQVLKGLATPDSTLIHTGATTMIHMSKQAMWTSHRPPSYLHDSADFVRSAKRLIDLSKSKDYEGASHTYAQLKFNASPAIDDFEGKRSRRTPRQLTCVVRLWSTPGELGAELPVTTLKLVDDITIVSSLSHKAFERCVHRLATRSQCMRE